MIDKTCLRISRLHIVYLYIKKIIEADVSNVGYGNILKQKYLDCRKNVVLFTSSHWNDIQKNYSTNKKLNIVFVFKNLKTILKKNFFYKIISKVLNKFYNRRKNLASK